MGQNESRSDDLSTNSFGMEARIGTRSAHRTKGLSAVDNTIRSTRRANLKSELDNLSIGSADSGAHGDDDGHFENAFEYGLADDTTQFFDVDGTGAGAGMEMGNGTRIPLSEEEKEQLRQELKKTEDEICTLRQVMSARLRYCNELKRKLGITPWVEVQEDLAQGLKTVKESQAYHKTAEGLQQATDVVSKKLGQIRSSNTFKSFEEKVGSAYSNVKAKIVASTSINELAGHRQSNAGTPGTQPTTPSTEKANLP